VQGCGADMARPATLPRSIVPEGQSGLVWKAVTRRILPFVGYRGRSEGNSQLPHRAFEKTRVWELPHFPFHPLHCCKKCNVENEKGLKGLEKFGLRHLLPTFHRAKIFPSIDWKVEGNDHPRGVVESLQSQSLGDHRPPHSKTFFSADEISGAGARGFSPWSGLGARAAQWGGARGRGLGLALCVALAGAARAYRGDRGRGRIDGRAG